jgi:hypothetical protein
VLNIIKKIENGSVGESNISCLCELLESHPDMIQESIVVLNAILIKGDIKAYNSAISALNKMAEKYIGFEHYSVDVIVNCMQERKNDLRENGSLKILEILSKITQKYPQRMRIAVPGLLIGLENTDIKCREMAYFMLSILAAAHHEFFKGRSKEIIRALNGLYVDERIYTCRLIKQLAVNDQTLVDDMHDILEDLRLNHPDCNLRSEAGFAMDKLKEDRKGISDDFSGLQELIVPNKKDIIDLLEGMNLRHMIINK